MLCSFTMRGSGSVCMRVRAHVRMVACAVCIDLFFFLLFI